MGLKFEVATLEGVPDAVRSLYVQKDGKFVLDVEGVAPAKDLADANGKIVEFRDNNVKLLKALGAESLDTALQRAALLQGIDPAKLAKLKDVDPEEYAALKAKAAELEKNGVKNSDDLTSRINAAVEAAVTPINQKLTDSERKASEAQKRADDALLRQAIGDRFVKAGGRPDALEFVVGKARESFRVVDNAVTAQENKFSADKPGQALGVEEWLAGVAKDFAFAFESSRGGGAAPGGPGGNGDARPGVLKIVNPTPQELGRLKVIPGKGLCNEQGQPVEIVQAK